jgi:thioredoxin-related protein
MKLIPLLLLFSFATGFAKAQDVPAADTILENAYRQAAAQNKNILVIFHASWCGWCHKMNNALNDKECKKILESNYVMVRLDVEESKDKKELENPGADVIKKKYHGEEAGLPFWLVIDKTGKLLADSYIRKPGVAKDKPGNNIGCPTSEEEIEIFIGILQKNAAISDSKLQVIARRFKNNKQITN